MGRRIYRLFGAGVSVPEIPVSLYIYIGLSLSEEKHFTEVDFLVIDLSFL